MPTQQEIHDLAKKLIDNKAYFDSAAVYFFGLSLACSQASESSKKLLTVLKKESRRWKKTRS